MALITPPGHLQAGTYTAKLDRLYLHTAGMTADASAPIAARQGFISGHVPGVANPSGMDVIMGPGAALIQNTFAASAGDYKVVSDANATVTLAASSPTQNRYDIVGWQIKDNFYDASGLNTVVMAVIQGANAAGTPVDPTLPSSFIPRARAVVNATDTSPTLQDLALRTVADGGVLPLGSVTDRNAISAPWLGLTVLRTDRQWEEWYTGSGWHVDGVAVCSSVADRDGASGITHPYNGQFAFTTDTNTAWVRQAGTWVPWFPNGITADLRQTVAQSMANAAFTALTFTTEDVDTHNGHSTSVNTSRYVAQIAGRYRLGGGVAFSPNGSASRGCAYSKNGTLIDGSQVLIASSGGLIDTVATGRAKTIDLAVGDYVEFCGYQNTGSPLNTSTQSSFLVEYVGT